MDTSGYLALFLDESRDSLRLLDASLLSLERDTGDVETIAAIFRVVHSLKGMSATVGMDAMAGLTHQMEDVLAALRDARAPASRPVVDALFGCLDCLRALVEGAVAGVEVDTTMAIARLGAAAASARGAGPPTARRQAPRAAAGTAAPSVRIPADRVDALAALASELDLRRRRLGEIARAHGLADLDAETGDLGRALDALTALVAGIRLTPVEDVFLRFPRVVRDLAQSLEKLVDLRIDGGDVAIDRAVADHLGEPLVHALRNAVDHGLEDPATRVAAGKPAVGVVRLSARREGSSVLIEVRDDGRGMDPQALRASAVRAGRMDVATALALPDADALRLVFLPGLSTARTITAISGRGVGMDAVLAAVEALGGEVAVTSVVGQGSTITFRLPLAQPCPPT